MHTIEQLPLGEEPQWLSHAQPSDIQGAMSPLDGTFGISFMTRYPVSMVIDWTVRTGAGDASDIAPSHGAL